MSHRTSMSSLASDVSDDDDQYPYRRQYPDDHPIIELSTLAPSRILLDPISEATGQNGSVNEQETEVRLRGPGMPGSEGNASSSVGSSSCSRSEASLTTADASSEILDKSKSQMGQKRIMVAANGKEVKPSRPDRSRKLLDSTKIDYKQHRKKSLFPNQDRNQSFVNRSTASIGTSASTDTFDDIGSSQGQRNVGFVIDEEGGSENPEVMKAKSKEGFLKHAKAKLKKTTRKNLRRIHSPAVMVNLVETVKQGDLGGFKELLAEHSSFNINKFDRNNLTLLHYAAIHNQDFIARDLLDRGANVDVMSLDIKATPLHAAARMNSAEVAHVLIARCADIENKTIDGMTPLHICGKRGHEKMAKIILKLGKADVTSRDKEKSTPLHFAAQGGNIDICKLMVEYGADIRAQDVNDNTPLMRAVMNGHLHIIDMFLDRARKTGIATLDYLMDADNESNTCLHIAVAKRRNEVIQRLLDNGVDVNVVKKDGRSPLHIAAIHGSTSTASQLIENGAEVDLPDDEGMLPLHRATLYNQVETMAFLIHNGSPVDEVDNNGFTPLLAAAWKGHKPAGELLLTRGACIEVYDREHKSPLHWAVEMDHVTFVKFLLKNGGKSLLNQPDMYEQTALHYAAETDNVEMIKLLVKYDVDGDVRDIMEKTPVHVAAQSGYVVSVMALLQHTPLLLNEEDRDGMTPLLTACYYGRHDMVRSLLKLGADITMVNDDHRTALMLAASNNHVETMSILIENNCDIHAVDKDKNNALHLCCESGHSAAANLLIRTGADQSTSNNEGFTPLELAIEKEYGDIAAAIIKSKDWRVAMQSKDEQMISPMKALIEKLPDVALLVMDRCVHKTYKNPQNGTSHEVKYEYQYIDPGPDDESTKENGYRYFAIRTMCQYGREKLLAHELSQSILKRKWNRFGRACYFLDLFLYITFLGLLTTYSQVSPPELYWDAYVSTDTGRLLNCPHFNLTDRPDLQSDVRFNEQISTFFYQDMTTSYLACAIIAYCVLVITGELGEIYVVRLKYLIEFGNYIDWVNLVCAIIFVYPPGQVPCVHNWTAGIIGVFFAWLKFIMYFKQFKTTGLYVLMFVETLRSLIKAMMVYVMFVISFSVTFNMIFFVFYRFSTNESSFLSVMTMMLGEFNKDDIFNETGMLGPLNVVAYVLFLAFLFLMPMVLNNLTIGIAVGDIEGIQKKAFIKRNSIQADYVYRLENKCPLWLQRLLYQPEYIMKISKNIYRVKFLSVLFPPEDAAFVEADDKSEPRNSEHVLDELSRQKATLEALKMMVRQQSDILRRLADKEGIVAKVQDISTLSELYEAPPASKDDENDPNASVA